MNLKKTTAIAVLALAPLVATATMIETPQSNPGGTWVLFPWANSVVPTFDGIYRWDSIDQWQANQPAVPDWQTLIPTEADFSGGGAILWDGQGYVPVGLPEFTNQCFKMTDVPYGGKCQEKSGNWDYFRAFKPGFREARAVVEPAQALVFLSGLALIVGGLWISRRQRHE